jgi:sterol desaturase/sphingolipid hydroxylase (fatty acid hydroxylase superfamily)
VPAILISIITYIGLRAFTLGIDSGDFGQIVTWRNFIVFYVFGAVRGYFYVIYLYFVFRDRQKYFAEVHKEMENGRSFWSHVLWCCARTGYSAMMMHIFNIFGTLYFYGLADEFEPSVHAIWNQNGWMSLCQLWLWALLSKKLLLFVLKMFVWEVWFDFGHYWGHRMGHAIKVLYDFGHSVHHESISPDAWDGLNITFDDALLTNFIHHMFSMFIVTRLIGS